MSKCWLLQQLSRATPHALLLADKAENSICTLLRDVLVLRRKTTRDAGSILTFPLTEPQGLCIKPLQFL